MTQEQEKGHPSEWGESATGSGVSHSASVSGEAWTGEEKLSTPFKNDSAGHSTKMYAAIGNALQAMVGPLHPSEERYTVMTDWHHHQKWVDYINLYWLRSYSSSHGFMIDFSSKLASIASALDDKKSVQLRYLDTLLKRITYIDRISRPTATNLTALSPEAQQAVSDALANDALRKVSSDFYAQRKRETGLTAAQRYAEAKRLQREQQ